MRLDRAKVARENDFSVGTMAKLQPTAENGSARRDVLAWKLLAIGMEPGWSGSGSSWSWRSPLDFESGCRYPPRTCVLGKVQPSLRDWSCSEPLPSTGCWAKFSRPFGTGSNVLLACRLSLRPVACPYGPSIAAAREKYLDESVQPSAQCLARLTVSGACLRERIFTGFVCLQRRDPLDGYN